MKENKEGAEEEPPSGLFVPSPFGTGASSRRFENSGTVTTDEPPAETFLKGFISLAAEQHPTSQIERGSKRPESVVRLTGFYECELTDKLKVINEQHMQSVFQEIVQAAVESGFTPFGPSVHKYDDNPESGLSAAIPVGESLIGVHTWPGLNMLDVNVHLCNVEHNNEFKIPLFTEKIQNIFGAKLTYVAKPDENGNLRLPLSVEEVRKLQAEELTAH